LRLRERWNNLSPLRKATSGVLGVLGAVMLLVSTWDRFGPVAPSYTRMSGDVNIAVAEFDTLREGGDVAASRTSSALARSVYEDLNRDLARLEGDAAGGLLAFDYEIQSPDQTGHLDGATPTERAAGARRIARRTDADIVAYAVLEDDGDDTTLTTEFFITDSRLISGAEELAGRYQLGEPLQQAGSAESNIAARRALREALRARTSTLLQLIVGLSYVSQGDNTTANSVFAELETRAGDLGSADGAEVLHLFHGNVLGRLGDLDGAEQHYRQSLAIDPDYSRSQIGLAEVTYQRARGRCDAATTDVDGVRRSIDGYTTARTALNRPPRANIDVKAAFGLGRAHLCLSMAGAQQAWPEARAELASVTTAYEAGNRDVTELAAEAWSSLGLLEIRTAAGDRAALERAVEDLETAIATTSSLASHDRQYLWYGFLGFARCQLGDTLDSEDAYTAAIRLSPPDSVPVYEAALERTRHRPTREHC
jgi:tetratricopeptide (TPR) repeat protein